MMKWRRVAVVAAAWGVASAAAVGVVACAKKHEQGVVSQPAIQATTRAAIKVKPAFAAIHYYDQSCANCHGPGGSFYGPTLGDDLTDAGLWKECKDMADGPAQAPIPDEAVDVETAYHRAIILGTPFVSVTKAEGMDWEGETMPGAKVALHAGSRKIEAKVEGAKWTAQWPEAVQAGEVKVVAELKGKMTELQTSKGMYSHTAALLPPEERKKH